MLNLFNHASYISYNHLYFIFQYTFSLSNLACIFYPNLSSLILSFVLSNLKVYWSTEFLIITVHLFFSSRFSIWFFYIVFGSPLCHLTYWIYWITYWSMCLITPIYRSAVDLFPLCCISHFPSLSPYPSPCLSLPLSVFLSPALSLFLSVFMWYCPLVSIVIFV